MGTEDANEHHVDCENGASQGHDEVRRDGTSADVQENKTIAKTAVKETSFRDKWKEPEYRRNVGRTVWLAAAFWGLGLIFALGGPTFLDLQIITETDVEQASLFFTFRSVGYLVGSLVAGVIYDLLNKSVLFLICVLGFAGSVVSLPWCSLYVLMIAIHFVNGVFGGSLETVGNAELVRMWGKEGEMAMQFIYFANAIGGVIAPLVAEPFLTPIPQDELNISITTTAAYPATNIITNESSSTTISNSLENSTAVFVALTTNVHYAYLISGIIIFLTAIPLCVQIYSDRFQKRRQNVQDEHQSNTQPLPLPLFLFVQGMLCVFYFLYCTAEDTFASFLTAFVVKQLHWSKSSGAKLSSVLWVSIAAGRFLSIFMVRVLGSAKLLTVCCVSLCLSMSAVFLFSAQMVDIGIWVSTVFVGLSMAAVFPTGFTWMEEELVRVTGPVASSVLIASSSGSIVDPIIAGYLMQEVSPLWFVYLLLIYSGLCTSVFFFLLAVSRLYIKKHYTIHKTESQEVDSSINKDESTKYEQDA